MQHVIGSMIIQKDYKAKTNKYIMHVARYHAQGDTSQHNYVHALMDHYEY